MAVTSNRTYSWTAGLIRDLRGRRTQTEFGQALGVPKNTIWRWEAGRCKPDENSADRLSDLAEREGFLADWRVAGSIRIVGDLEKASRELRDLCEESLDLSARRLAEG